MPTCQSDCHLLFAGCLALAELGRRGLLLPSRLDTGRRDLLTSLTAITGTTILVPYLKSLQRCWRLGTCTFNLRVPDLKKSCRDLTTGQSTMIVAPFNNVIIWHQSVLMSYFSLNECSLLFIEIFYGKLEIYEAIIWTDTLRPEQKTHSVVFSSNKIQFIRTCVFWF